MKIKNIVLTALFIVLSSLCFGSTTYVSQSGGSVSCGADGTQSTTAQASVTWSNTNPYKGCGTFTSEMTINASGTVGNPITFTFESGSGFSAAAFNPAAIEMSGQSYILIDGGTPCGTGTTCSANLSGTAILQNTANGTGLGNNIGTTMVDLGQSSTCAHDIEVRNLLVLNVYVKNSLTDEGTGASNSLGIGGIGCTANILIHDNTATYAHNHFQVGCTTNGGNNYQIYNNVASEGVWGVNAQIGSGTNIVCTNLLIYNNDINMGQAWSDNTITYHIDGIFVFGQNSALYWNGVYIYNNYLHGNWSNGFTNVDPSGFIYANQNLVNLYMFNNVLYLTGNATSNGLIAVGYATVSQFEYNNTFVGYSTSSNTSGAAMGDASSNAANSTTLENNVVSTFQAAILFTDGSANEMVLIDYNDYYNVSGSGVCNPWTIGAECPVPFSAWQACTSLCVATGSPDAHGTIGNPLLTGTFHLTSASSAAWQTGANLYSKCNGQPNPGLGALCFDKNGTARPPSGPWDMGAYEDSGATATPTAPKAVLFAWDWNGEHWRGEK